MASISSRHKSIQRAFFSYGWLMPVWLPLSQVGGRALFDILAYSYIIWGLASLYGKSIQLDRGFLLLYTGLLVAFFLGVPGAEDSAGALKQWLVFLLRSLTVVFTLAALQQSLSNLEHLQRTLALSGLLMLVMLYVVLILLLQRETFEPELQLRENNLPFLLPFLLFWVWQADDRRWRYGGMAAVSMVVFTYVAMSGGRAALVGLVVAMTVFGLVVLNWRLIRVGAVALLVGVLGLAINTTPLNRTVDQHSGWVYGADAFTSGRTVLWRQALEHPPERPLIGVGMNNVRYVDEVLTIGNERVQHLHNFIMDAWYETGILGVIFLLALLGYVFAQLAWAWSALNPATRCQAGPFLAASLAIIAAACLNFSYTSRQFTVYLFMCLAVLLHLSSATPVKDKPDAGS